MMNQQSQGTGSLSPADLPAKRKRGRPRKDDGHVQGENIPTTPVPDSTKKNKQTAVAIDPAEDDMVGQVVSGFIEGSFDAGYLLNVKVGDTDTHLRGLVFLPGRFIPVTAANDVAPNAKMYTRKNIPIPVQSTQTRPGDLVPPSEQIKEQATEVKIDEPKFPDQLLPSELLSGIPNTGENKSASVILSLGDDLPRNETGLTLGEKVPQQKISDSEQESQTPAFMTQLTHDKAVKQDEGQQGTDMEMETTKESEPASALLVDVTPSTGNINQEPRVGNQALSSDLKPNELVHNEVKDLKNEDNETALGSVRSEPVGITMLMQKPNLEDNQTPLFAEPEAMPSELTGIEMVMKKPNLEDNRTPLFAEPEAMPSEPIGIDMVMKKSNLEDNRTPLFAEPEAMPSEPIGIDMVMKKPNLEHIQTPLFAEPEAMPSEPIGIDMVMKKPNLEDNRTPLFAEPEAMPSEPIGINMVMKKPNLEDNRTPLFAEPESMPSEPIGISMLMEKPNLEHNQNLLFGEPKSMSPEPIGINFHVDKQNSPKQDTQDVPSELANKTLFGDDTSYPVGETANITAGGSFSVPMTNLSVMLFEGEAVPSQPTSLGNEGPAIPRMIDTQICSSTSATNNGDSGIKDAITSTHLELSSGLNLSGSG